MCVEPSAMPLPIPSGRYPSGLGSELPFPCPAAPLPSPEGSPLTRGEPLCKGSRGKFPHSIKVSPLLHVDTVVTAMHFRGEGGQIHINFFQGQKSLKCHKYIWSISISMFSHILSKLLSPLNVRTNKGHLNRTLTCTLNCTRKCLRQQPKMPTQEVECPSRRSRHSRQKQNQLDQVHLACWTQLWNLRNYGKAKILW